MIKLSAALVIGTLALAGCGAATASASEARPASSSSSGISSSSSFVIQSMTFVSDQQGFALGTVKCGSRRCEALLGTTSGGTSWTSLTAPVKNPGGPYHTCPSGQPCVSQVRFATPKIGYAFDPSLYRTSDGGQHWTRVAAPTVSSLETADGSTVRIAYPGQGCSGAPYQVQKSALGSSAWHNLVAPPIEMICPPVLYRQHERLVLVGYGNPAGGVRATAEIDRSADGGTKWSHGPDKCGGKDGYASAVAIGAPDALVELCSHQLSNKSGGYGLSWVRVSANDGATFGPDRTIPLPSGLPKNQFYRYQIAAASPSRLIVVISGQHSSRVLTSANGGRTWSVTLTPPGSASVLLVGFEDSVTARVAQSDTVWTTRDGGQHWTASGF